MAYSASPVHSSSGNQGSGSNLSLGLVCSPNNLLLAWYVNSNDTTVRAVSDDTNGTYATLVSNTATVTSQCISLKGVINTAVSFGSRTLTFTGAGLGQVGGIAEEWSGNPSTITGIVDVSGTGGTASNVATTNGVQPSITITNAGDLIASAALLSGSYTSPSTSVGSMDSNTVTAGAPSFAAYYLPGATGSYSPFFSWTTVRKVQQITAGLLPAGSADLTVNVSDSTSLTESVKPEVNSFMSKSDSITTSEFRDIIRNNSRDATVSDTVNNSEALILLDTDGIGILDTVNSSESITVQVTVGIDREPANYQDGKGVVII